MNAAADPVAPERKIFIWRTGCPETKSEMLRTSQIAGIMYDQNLDEDIRSLRQLVIYGLKGISAYGHQARELGYYSDDGG